MQELAVRINKMERSYTLLLPPLGSEADFIAQVTSYNGDFDAGCLPQIHPQTITLLAKPIIEARPLGLLKAKPFKSGKRLARSYGYMANVGISLARVLISTDGFFPRYSSGLGKECSLVCVVTVSSKVVYSSC